MSLYFEWKDFVLYVVNPDRQITETDRLNTANAVETEDTQYSVSRAKENGFRIRASMIVDSEDEFEAMEIGQYGEVTIWTKDKVWCIRRDIEYSIEKLIFLPRNPTHLQT